VEFLVRFGHDFDVELMDKDLFFLIRYAVSLFRVARRRIEQSLARKGVRLVILVNHYQPVKMLVTTIARSAGIPVVELQHGNMGRYHIGYNFGHTDPLPTLPDEIFTFGSFWNETSRIRANGVVLTAVGMPLFEERIRALRPAKPGEKTRVLFLSQETVGPRMGRLAMELSRIVDSEAVEIWYKLHPRERDVWDQHYPEGFGSANIQLFADEDLYDLLNRSDIHVGVYSTTVIESLVFSKPLALVEAYGVHYFTDLLDHGRAYLVRDAPDLLSIIRTSRKKRKQSDDVSIYWQSDSRRRILERIEELLH
jgi:hypothetical protein